MGNKGKRLETPKYEGLNRFTVLGHCQAKGQGLCPKGNVRAEKEHVQGARLCELTKGPGARPVLYGVTGLCSPSITALHKAATNER